MKAKSYVIAIALFSLFTSIGFAQMKSGTKVTKEELAKLEKMYNNSKASLKKSPKDAKVKKQFISTANSYANANMYADWIPPKDRYPKSLKVFREVKALDPNNKEAGEWIKMIEGIYKSMGKPVPKG